MVVFFKPLRKHHLLISKDKIKGKKVAKLILEVFKKFVRCIYIVLAIVLGLFDKLRKKKDGHE